MCLVKYTKDGGSSIIVALTYVRTSWTRRQEGALRVEQIISEQRKHWGWISELSVNGGGLSMHESRASACHFDDWYVYLLDWTTACSMSRDKGNAPPQWRPKLSARNQCKWYTTDLMGRANDSMISVCGEPDLPTRNTKPSSCGCQLNYTLGNERNKYRWRWKCTVSVYFFSLFKPVFISSYLRR